MLQAAARKPPAVQKQPGTAQWQMQCKRIVVGFDFDGASHLALQVASVLARWLGAEVIIAHSVSLPPTKAQTSQALSHEISQMIMEAESAVRRAIRNESDLAVIPHKTIVRYSSPSRLLTELAELEQSDLIIVGAHGRHGIGQLFLGSVSESVLRDATCPVLILGPSCELDGNGLHSVLLASDLLHTGIGAAQYAGRIARERDAALYLIHVLPEKSRAENRQRESTEASCIEKLMQALEPTDRETVTADAFVAYGKPSEEILAAATAKHADLLVSGVGVHGPLSDHAPWRTLTELVGHCRCPILCVGDRSR